MDSPPLAVVEAGHLQARALGAHNGDQPVGSVVGQHRPSASGHLVVKAHMGSTAAHVL